MLRDFVVKCFVTPVSSARGSKRVRRSARPRHGRKSSPTATDRDERLAWTVLWLIATAVVVAAAIVRVAASRGELWLDEIWSYRLAGLQSSPLAVFTAIHHDNNHHLNTLYLYFIQASASWITYRLHTLVTGVATVVLAGIIANRSGRRTALIAMLLAAGSFLLVLYASEARGYALAVFFAFLAIPLADRYFASGRLVWAAAFGVAATLGLLSHLTFLHAYVGLGAWTTYRAARGRPRHIARTLSALHLLPCIAFAVLYWIDLQHIVIGGGPTLNASEVLARTLSLGAGGPVAGPYRGGVVAVALISCIGGVFAARRCGSDLWVLLLVTTIVAPALTFAFVGSNLLYERYFLVVVAFGLMASSWALDAIARRSRVAALAVVAAFLAGNSVHIARLIRDGRGSYIPALTRISEQAVQRPVTIGGDHDFRQGHLVEFYQHFVPRGSEIEYHASFEWAVAGPEWYLVHSQEPTFQPEPELIVEGGRRYELSATYRHDGPSGWSLAVYHNVLALR